MSRLNPGTLPQILAIMAAWLLPEQPIHLAGPVILPCMPGPLHNIHLLQIASVLHFGVVSLYDGVDPLHDGIDPLK